MPDEETVQTPEQDQEPKREYVPWSQYRKSLSENKDMRTQLDEQAETLRAMQEKVDQFSAVQTPPANGLQSGGAYDEFARDPAGYVQSQVQQGIDREQWNRGKDRAVDYLKEQKEYGDDPGFEGEVSATLKEMRKDPEMATAAAIALLREQDAIDKKEPESGKSSGDTRVSKRAVASLKGAGKGNGGFTRAQLKNMTDEEFVKNQSAIMAAQEAGLITD